MSSLRERNETLSRQLAALAVISSFVAIVLLVTLRHYTTGVKASTILSIAALAMAGSSIILNRGVPFYG